MASAFAGGSGCSELVYGVVKAATEKVIYSDYEKWRELPAAGAVLFGLDDLGCQIKGKSR